MKASDHIVDFLSRKHITHVFEVVGGMITHIIDSLSRAGHPQVVSFHHEQAAAFAAEGFARMTGIPGVSFATSGPGATNLLTGIGSCYFDSIPAIFITGQVNRNEQKGNRPVRQLGFQETDIVSIAAPITKAAWRIDCPEDLPALLNKAYHIALSGRPGPVLLDIPMDVQRSDIEAPSDDFEIRDSDPFMADPEEIDSLLSGLFRAKRPLILAGGGIRSAGAAELFRAFIDDIGCPVVNSLMGVDALPSSHPLHVGMIGSYGNRWANLAIDRSDFLLVIGSRLDVRQTGSDTRYFKGERVVYHVDCDPGEMNNRVTGCFAVIAHIRSFLETALKLKEIKTHQQTKSWLAEIRNLRNEWPDTAELKSTQGINPNQFMHQLSHWSSAASAYVVDVGQHQMWAGQSIELAQNQRFLTSGGMGAMGFALPAAIGAALAVPGRPVVLIAGDGGFQFNIQELQTVVRNHLPVKLIIINNRCLGMVRQFQQSYFQERYQSTFWGYSAPNFCEISKAYGIDACMIGNKDDVTRGLQELWADPMNPFLVEVSIDTFANAYPKIAFGHPLSEMEPSDRPADK
jgi:acetolactate synthase I/II/III large subunit